MSTIPLPAGAAADPLDWRRKFLERKYREVYLPEIVQDPFEVDGIPLQPAEALEKCRPDQYQVALTEYARREGDDALNSACEDFPAPVAISLFRALNSATNEHERLMHYRDAAEALILVLMSVVLGECRSKGLKLVTLTYSTTAGNQENLTAAKIAKASVGFRLAMLRSILAWASTQPSLACGARIPMDGIIRLGDLKDIRNDFSHLQAMSPAEAERVCQDMREQFADAILAFEWLAETQLVSYGGTVDGKPTVAKFEVHSGHSQSKPIRELTVSSGALTKCMSISKPLLTRPLIHVAGEVFEATPFLHTELASKGHRRHILMMKKGVISGADIEYEIAGEREPRNIANSPTTVDLNVLNDLF